MATPLFLVGVDELLSIDRGHALVGTKARAENELLTGLRKESGEILTLVIHSPEGVDDILIFGIDQSEDCETCDEICGKRHGKILKRALIIFDCIIHRVAISPESVHG